MQIAFLTHEPFFPPSGGGSAEAVYLIQEMVRRHHSVEVFCPDFPAPDETANRFGCRFHRFTQWRMGRYARWRTLKYLLYPGQLESLVRSVSASESRKGSRPFDVIVAQHTISSVAAGRLRRRFQVPVIFNYLDYLTGFMETWPSWMMPRPLVRALTRFELSLPQRYDVEGVMTVSIPLAERLTASGFPANRVRPIQYGFDSHRFKPQTELNPTVDRPPVVVMHGSFDRHHLGPIAEQTVMNVWRQRPEVCFRFVGAITDGLRSFAHRLRVACPGVHLDLPGFVDYPEVSRYLSDADVGWIPYEESNGTHCAFVAKAVEYLACGLPVASTRLENLARYFAGEPAMAFSRFDGKELAGNIVAWLNQPRPQRMALGMAARQRVVRELDWSVITGNAVDFIETIVAGNRGGSAK